MFTTLLATGLLSWSAAAAPFGIGGAASLLEPAQDPPDFEEYRQGWDDRRYAGPRARLIVDGGRDLYSTGDRLRVRFSVTEDAHVALIHIDPDGRLEFLYPSSPWESDFVRGGRSYSLPRAYQAGLRMHSRPGIGYLYLIASPVPLDYRHFGRGRGSPWDWSYGGRMVTGDPFWAMEQISRLLVPGYVPYASDYFTYYVGGRHAYPAYACSDGYRGTRGGWGWSSSFGSCSRMDLFLRQHPHYFDARRYRGDRRGYIARTHGPPPAQHRFKEPATGAAPNRAPQQQPVNRAPAQPRRPDADAVTPTQRPPARTPAVEPERSTERRSTQPAQRPRPTLERRGQEAQQSGSRPSAPAASPERRPAPRQGAQGSSGASGERNATPAPAADRRGTERREAPAARPAPSRESSSSGSARSRRPPGDES